MLTKSMFAPSRVRGLKRANCPWLHKVGVRTFTGAWIETVFGDLIWVETKVRTFTGAWIETVLKILLKTLILRFAPSRVRGLKPLT